MEIIKIMKKKKIKNLEMRQILLFVLVLKVFILFLFMIIVIKFILEVKMEIIFQLLLVQIFTQFHLLMK